MKEPDLVQRLNAHFRSSGGTFHAELRSKDDLEVKADFGAVYVVDPGQGTTNYNKLINKPQINSVELKGNKSLPDIGVDTISNIELENILQ